MKMKIHLGLILFFISSSLFASSKAEGGNRQIEEAEEENGKMKETEEEIKRSLDVETLNVQLQIVSLLKEIKEQIKEQNNEVIKEISNGLKENTKVIKEISNQLKENTKEISNGLKETTKEILNGQKENTKQAKENTKVIIDFISQIKDNTNGIKENTDEIKTITINIKDITDGIGENNEKEKEVISEIKEITNDIMQDIDGLNEIAYVVTNSTEYLKEIKDYLFPARNCDDLRLKGDVKSGIRTVHPYLYSPEKSIEVLCDQQTEGGGWTVFQARENLPSRENFQRNWNDYSHGFGSLNGEFWMGLEWINVMTKLDVMELRVDLEDDTGEKRFAKYESFSVEDENEKFKLNIGTYGGTAGDSLSYNNQHPFSTHDRDNDGWARINCAVTHKRAWWYDHCHYANLNGYQHVGKYSSSIDGDGINWEKFRGNRVSMAKTKMMFRLSGRIN